VFVRTSGVDSADEGGDEDDGEDADADAESVDVDMDMESVQRTPGRVGVTGSGSGRIQGMYVRGRVRGGGKGHTGAGDYSMASP
jgi:hypothetical protein